MTSPANVVAQIAGQGPPGTTIQVSVASIALLEAFADAPLLDGSVAFVSGVGYYTLAKTSTATADGYLVLTTSSGTGRWVLQLPISIANPALLVTDWYLDGAAGVDSNSGTDAQHPVKTIMGGIVPKWGSASPLLAQTTTIHVLVGQAVGLERAVLSPVMVGASNFVIVGTPTNIGAAFAASTVTAKVRGNPGNDLTIASMPGGAAAGVLVRNTTRTSSAIIHAMASSTATMSQPFTDGSLTTPSSGNFATSDTWTTGDNLQLQALPVLNLVSIEPLGGDTNAGFTAGFGWVQFVHVPDATGVTGQSNFAVTSTGLETFSFAECVFDSFVVAASDVACDFGGCQFNGGGELYTNGAISGGSIPSFMVVQGGFGFRQDIVCSGVILFEDGCSSIAEAASGIHLTSAGSIAVFNGAALNLLNPNSFWGAGTINNSGTIQRNVGNSWATVLPLANLNLDLFTVGYAASGVGQYGPFLVTPANLDTYGSLRNPSSVAIYSDGARRATPATPVTWTQSVWKFDPTNSQGTSSDNNDGKTNATALRTWAGVISKLGTESPHLGQATTFTFLSAQSAGVDEIFFSPRLHDGGQAILLGTLVANGGTFSPVGLTAKTRGGPGQLLTLTTVPGGVAAKNLIFNSTRSSYAFVDSVGGGNAVMTQPVASSSITTTAVTTPTLTEDNTWASGDTYQANTLTALNLKVWRPQGADSSSTVACAGWVQFVEVVDSSGNGGSIEPLTCDAALLILSACRVDTRLHIGTLAGRGEGVYLIGCDVTGAVTFFGGIPEAFGGVLRGGLNVINGTPVLDGDLTVHGTWTINGGFVFAGAVYGDGTATVQGGSILRLGTSLWGSVAVTVNPQSSVWNAGANFATTLPTSGALKLGANTTGSKYSAGVWTDSINLTAANLDTNNGLQDPNTGARFCNTS